MFVASWVFNSGCDTALGDDLIVFWSLHKVNKGLFRR